ncbi:MAG: PorT family protein [Prevotellaceae bacterium]|nr:PorT family protein [Prevotellaceae bacterium]
MKRTLLILVTVLLVGSVQAQFRFGVKAGVNFSEFNSKNQVLKKDGAAWQAGFAAQFKIPLIGLGIQPELLYSINKGANNSIGFFTVPVNLRWQPLPIPVIKPVILVGPYFGYAVNFKGFQNFRNDIKRFDWGIGLGGGVEIWKFQIEGRYNWGLQELGKKAKELNLKNNVFTLSAIYFF